jgi:hypothetical protein
MVDVPFGGLNISQFSSQTLKLIVKIEAAE